MKTVREKEVAFHASKWIRMQALIDGCELKALFNVLETFTIYPIGRVTAQKKIEKEHFLQKYHASLELLRKNSVPKPSDFREILPCALSAEEEALYWIPIDEEKGIIKPQGPVLLMQAHYLSYSAIDETIRPMSLGKSSVFWGLQFSFPQLYQDLVSEEICQTNTHANHRLFIALRKWLRNATKATPFKIQEKKVNSPIRLGKKCVEWIDKHPQLGKEGVAHGN